MIAKPDALAEWKEARAQLSTALVKQERNLTTLLPPDMPADRFRSVVMSAVARDPALLTCDMGSMVRAVVQAAECGLYIGGSMGEAYLVPFWNGRKSRREVQFVPGYKGLIKRALDDGRVQRIEAECVYEGDEFAWSKGTTPAIAHVPSSVADRVDVDRLKHAYAVAFFTSGATQFEVLDRRQLDAIRGKSKARDRSGNEVGPWKSDTLAMYRKCPIRSLFRFLPLSPRAQSMLRHEEDPEPALRGGGERTAALKARLGAPIDAPSNPIDDLDPEELEDESDDAKT